MSEMKNRQKELSEAFSDMLDWKERYHYIIDLGKDLSPYPEEFREDTYKVSACVSQVWLHAYSEKDKIYFHADSDSIFVKGEIALLLQLYNDIAPSEIVESSPEFIKELGITENLSPNRANGLGSMVNTIFSYAKDFIL